MKPLEELTVLDLKDDLIRFGRSDYIPILNDLLEARARGHLREGTTFPSPREYLAVLKHAPAGVIGQAFVAAVGNPGFQQPMDEWLGATGHWSTTDEAALASLLRDVDHCVGLTRGRIQRLQEKLAYEKQRLVHLQAFLKQHTVVNR